MDRPEFLIFPQEVAIREELYRGNPLRIVQDFLACINSEGHQVFEIPPHVIRAMAERFRQVVTPKHDGDRLNSLDEAFGGRIGRRRNSLEREEVLFSTAFRQISAMEKARRQTSDERGATPFEVAAQEVAAEEGISDEAVRKRYKEAGKR